METIYTTIRQIAFREEVTTEVHFMSIGDYAPFMQAPHRMDLMVSAMTKNGKWHCNQKCVHCYAAGQTLSDEFELPTESWKKILDRCRSAGIPQVTFTGGEPTMREDLFELVKYARWFISRLNTNGIKLTPEYCQKLREAELDSVQITFYSCDPEIHNKLVGAPHYEDTLAGIKNALAQGLSVSINTPLCTLNRDYEKTLEFLHELGVIYVTCAGADPAQVNAVLSRKRHGDSFHFSGLARRGGLRGTEYSFTFLRRMPVQHGHNTRWECGALPELARRQTARKYARR